MAIAGECMVTRPFSASVEPGFLEVFERLRSADFCYAHVETNFGRFSEVGPPSRSDQVGSYFMTDPQVAADLKWAGVDMVSLANNHSFDYGVDGLMATMRHCEEAGLVHAGTGRDLEEAREPAYLETTQGRVALVSVSSGNKSQEWATLPKSTLPGRPGVNSLRPLMRFVIDERAGEEVKRMGKELGILREKGGRKVEGSSGLLNNARDDEFSLAMPSDQSTTGSNLFQVSDHFDVESSSNEWDLRGNLRAIEEATTMADLVVVAHHFNVSERGRGDTPPKFVRDFAHSVIDAGADVFIGHGWHKTLGIEIYQGKPIFYGLGNFFAQSEFVRRVPFDSYETWRHDIEALPTLTPAVHPLHPGLDTGGLTWWSSAAIELELEDKKLVALRLYPVELGREVSKAAPIRRPVGSTERVLTDGRPFMATGADAEAILERYQRLSAEFGTKLEIESGIGIVRP